jgi:putative ABC transport system permease protein
VLSAVLVGLAPALRAGRHVPAGAVRAGGRGTGRRERATQGALVAAEVAVSLVLLVGAGLLLRSFERLRAVDPGVEPSSVATMLVAASPSKYPGPAEQRMLFAQVAERTAALPGVLAVGLCDCLPPDMVRSAGSVRLEGRTADAAAALPVVDQIRVGANYFGALRVPVVAGRAFTETDRADAPAVAVVSETFARRHLAGGARGAGALGQRVSLDDEHWLTVVGVVADVHHDGLAAPADPALYVPFSQDPFPGMNLFVRTAGEPLDVVPSVRRAVLQLDPELPLARVATLDAVVAASVAGARFNTSLLAAFAALAFVLAAVGIYGVVAYGVTQRRQEMGVRIALGAPGAAVVRLVVGHALRPVWLGVGVGLAAAAGGARVLERLLYGTSAHDPRTYAVMAALLVGVAALAAYAPGRRAATADPLLALKGE